MPDDKKLSERDVAALNAAAASRAASMRETEPVRRGPPSAWGGVPQAVQLSPLAGPVAAGGGTALQRYMAQHRRSQEDMPTLRRGLVPAASKMPRRPLEQTDEVFDVNKVDPSELPAPGGSADLNAALLAVRSQRDNQKALEADVIAHQNEMRKYAEEQPVIADARKAANMHDQQGLDWHEIIKRSLQEDVKSKMSSAEKAAKEPKK